MAARKKKKTTTLPYSCGYPGCKKRFSAAVKIRTHYDDAHDGWRPKRSKKNTRTKTIDLPTTPIPPKPIKTHTLRYCPNCGCGLEKIKL